MTMSNFFDKLNTKMDRPIWLREIPISPISIRDRI